MSHLRSTRKQYLPGLADNGTVSLECHFTGGTEQMRLFDMFNNTSDPEQMRILIPIASGSTTFHRFTFLGIISKWSIADATDTAVKLSITVQTTGGVTYSSGPNA